MLLSPPFRPASSPFKPSLWALLSAVLLLGGLVTPFAVGATCQQGPSGGYLLRKAETLQAAGQLDAAAAVYNQATAAFRRNQDADGQQQALLKLAALEEKRADQLLASLDAAPAARLASQGPTAATLFAQAQRLAAAGNKAAAATAYQQAYEAYMSVDDSEGMTRALARKNALGGATPTPARPTAPRLVPMAAARPAPVAAPGRAAAPPAAGAAPLAGRMVGGKPLGLFFVTKSVLGNFMTMTYYFGPDGMAYENPVGLTAAELVATPAKSKGRYSVNGKTLSIAWNGYPKPEVAEMQMLGGGFSWSGASIFSAVGPFRSASQLVGKFEGGTSTIASAMGQATVSKTLIFKADGTWSGGGVSTVTSVTERSVAETGGSSANTGHWRLDGWFLTLTDAQGHTVRDVAYPIGNGKDKVTLFNFNGMAYSRQ